jgi:hypothetical protein
MCGRFFVTKATVIAYSKHQMLTNKYSIVFTGEKQNTNAQSVERVDRKGSSLPIVRG